MNKVNRRGIRFSSVALLVIFLAVPAWLMHTQASEVPSANTLVVDDS